jgi:hypothetical protein
MSPGVTSKSVDKLAALVVAAIPTMSAGTLWTRAKGWRSATVSGTTWRSTPLTEV